MKRQGESLGEFGILMYRDASALPQELSEFAACLEKKKGATLVYRPAAPDVVKVRAKARHDARGAVRTLTLFLDAVDRGYRFDDDLAQEKIRALKQAATVLAQDSKLVQMLLED